MTPQFTDIEWALLRRLTKEMEMWPGAAETPHGYELSEEDDETLWSIIEKLRETK